VSRLSGARRTANGRCHTAGDAATFFFVSVVTATRTVASATHGTSATPAEDAAAPLPTALATTARDGGGDPPQFTRYEVLMTHHDMPCHAMTHHDTPWPAAALALRGAPID